MDTILLKYHMAKRGYTVRSLAKAMNLDVATMSKKINNRTLVTLDETKRITSLLALNRDDVWDIFFYS